MVIFIYLFLVYIVYILLMLVCPTMDEDYTTPFIAAFILPIGLLALVETLGCKIIK